MAAITHFVGIDWSGAKGTRHVGLAVAMCEAGQGAPAMVAPPSGRKAWSRQEISDWIAGGMGLEADTRALVGIDSAFSLPFIDQGAFLPGESLPEAATALWPELNSVCAEAVDLYGGPFVDAYPAHYLRTGARGVRFARRLRVTERRAIDSGAGPCESVFHLIGPSQVGLSGLSTMRMLAALAMEPSVSIWPFEEQAGARVTLVEIYAAAFARMGGHKGKIRDLAALNTALAGLGTAPLKGGAMPGEHAADAIVTAAGLRHAGAQRKYWHPEALSTKVRRTEGWIFGVI